jgi:hypothetical protein
MTQGFPVAIGLGYVMAGHKGTILQKGKKSWDNLATLEKTYDCLQCKAPIKLEKRATTDNGATINPMLREEG